MEFTTLNNGVKMPLVGFGVMEIPNAEEGEQIILSALAAGYRLLIQPPFTPTRKW